jgi:diguanylate cyclase (GGDEF)-like protein
VTSPSEDRDDVVSASEWRALSDREFDLVVTVDSSGVCLSTIRSEWIGRPLGEVLASNDPRVVEALLGESGCHPVWVRVHEGADDHWMHAVSIPRATGGWVVQFRELRLMDLPHLDGHHEIDETTGLASRERALDEVAFLLAATPRTGKEIAVALCGFDGFTELNDRVGAIAGDEVLQIAAGRIGDALRSGDLVARFDGDQFLVLLRGVHHLRGAIRVANKIRVAVEDPIDLAGTTIDQTISVGVTLISRGESVYSVLERAQGALAMAKSAGRNTVMSSPPL